MPAKRLRSAGIILYQPDTPAGRKYLLLDHGTHWDFPKGGVKPGESDRQAALRELGEETGIRSVALSEYFQSEPVYYYCVRGEVCRKAVVFFLGSTTKTEVILSPEHVGYAFLTYPEAAVRLTYPTSRDLLRRAEVQFLPIS